MTWVLERRSQYSEDFSHLVAWYYEQGGEHLAARVILAIDGTLERLEKEATLGRKRHFSNPLLQGLRSIPVERPFQKALLFYRVRGETIELCRLMHGARDLERRLSEPTS